ncbi:MAG: TlpA disulfide reductase family protein [Bryobacteraceae bacterium]
MKRLLPVLLILGAGLVHAIELKPMDESGYTRLLASYKGKVLLVNFWATWCAPCRKEMPELAALAAKYKSKGLELVTVAIDEESDRRTASEFLDKAKVPPPAYIKNFQNDEKFISMVDSRWSGGLPFTVIYDRAGKKARVFPGELNMKELEEFLRKIL